MSAPKLTALRDVLVRPVGAHPDDVASRYFDDNEEVEEVVVSIVDSNGDEVDGGVYTRPCSCNRRTCRDCWDDTRWPPDDTRDR